MLILNKKIDTIPHGAVYIARGSGLGNPDPIGVGGTREEVLASYETYLYREVRNGNPLIWLKLLQLKEDSILVCNCKPAACHGDIIERVWREFIQCYQHERVLSYAGVGWRNTPDWALAIMQKLAYRLDELGFVLRSGGARGADSAFEAGSTHKEIFLPEQGFRGKYSVFDAPSLEAFRLAEHLHPTWNRLSPFIKALMARNCHQVLGHDLRSPVDFLVCYTQDGVEKTQYRTIDTGGTGLAIELADTFKIPVFNLKNPDAMDRLKRHIQSHPTYGQTPMLAMR